MFTKILIANRGEIACRVAATAQKLGVRTVAVYSDADAKAKHVSVCDEAVRIGAAAAQESYLLMDRVIEAARETGAQAIHPGYGFLSENAAFAEACARAGIAFIGPPADAIRAMGSKSAAKSLMESAGVPLVPGYHGQEQDAHFLHQQADRIGYPVLIKASAGGGGKGMRIVESSAAFVAALESCRREAKASFGDDRVLIEKYLVKPRHIEIQVFADTHGNCVYLFERDCSVQRRHQKVLEEAPAPGMDPMRRAAMGEAAVAAAKAVGYVGAGTVEFIANQDGSFYFMEMNTRLQVEHPVTEMITGFDLVEWQLKIASGLPLPRSQAELRIHGHAIEARIYAENPDKGFLPATGTLKRLRTPAAVEFRLNADAAGTAEPAAVRIDSGVREGDAISPFYDPMIAKLIVWGNDRAEALLRMQRALEQTQIVGLATNVAFLARLIGSKAFVSATLDTGLIERNHDELFPAPTPVPASALALATAAVLEEEFLHRELGTDGPWRRLKGWRANMESVRTLEFHDPRGASTLAVRLHYRGGTPLLAIPPGTLAQAFTIEGSKSAHMRVSLGPNVIEGDVLVDAGTVHVFHHERHDTLVYLDPMLHAGQSEEEAGRLTAPMPGKIVAILVKTGTEVAKGDALMVMEAMKMEHTIFAPSAGVVTEIRFLVGDQVTEGSQLVTFATATS